MESTRKATNIRLFWDDQPGVTPGWYAEIQDQKGQCITDSVKVDFPFDVDDYGLQNEGELKGKLLEHFPNCTFRP